MTQLIADSELTTPNLSQAERAALLLALNSVILGTGEVYVAMTYHKQTKAKPRLPGVDYVAMPGVAPTAFMGRLWRVARNKKHGHVYFYITSSTRGDGKRPTGHTNLLPAGLQSFVIFGFQPNMNAVPQPTMLQQGPGAP